jgi:hypothetical protein
MMSSNRILWIVVAAWCGMCIEGQLSGDELAKRAEDNDTLYAFTFFRDNGQDGVYLAISDDGLKWREVNASKPIMTPQVGGKLTRDPSIVLGGDGKYHMVWTTSWTGDGFGIAHSTDLLTWSEQTYVAINQGDDKAKNTWAPEIFYDAAMAQYLVIWATTREGDFPETATQGDGGYNHRMYASVTKDFVNWSPKFLFFNGGFNVIDAFLFKKDDRYGLIVKDETLKPTAAKDLHVVWSTGNALGPWDQVQSPFTDRKIAWAEGPAALQVEKRWLIYFDQYEKGRYAAVETADFKTFQEVAVELPKGARHGTMVKVDPATAKLLRALP